MQGHYPAQDRVFRLWKNGGGETAEVVVSPEAAALETFDWRLSTARVAASGAFSHFGGVDRLLTVLEGGAMRLVVADQAVDLAPGAAPFAFAGDLPCHAQLMGPALLDFNVMVRRPLRAEAWIGALARPEAGARADYALLLQPGAGFAKYDLLDLQALNAAKLEAVLGLQAVSTRIF